MKTGLLNRILLVAAIALPAMAGPVLAAIGPVRYFRDPQLGNRIVVMTEGTGDLGTITVDGKTYRNLRIVETSGDTICWMATINAGTFEFFFYICWDLRTNTWTYREGFRELLDDGIAEVWNGDLIPTLPPRSSTRDPK